MILWLKGANFTLTTVDMKRWDYILFFHKIWDWLSIRHMNTYTLGIFKGIAKKNLMWGIKLNISLTDPSIH